MKSVYSAVRTGSLNKAVCFVFKVLISWFDVATVDHLPVSGIRNFTAVSPNETQDSRPISKISPFLILTINCSASLLQWAYVVFSDTT